MCRYKCTSRFKCRNTTTTTTIEAFFLSFCCSHHRRHFSLISKHKKSQCNVFVLYSCEYIFTPWTWSLKQEGLPPCHEEEEKKICNWKRPTLTGQKKNCINALFQRRQKTFNVCFHKRQSTLSLKTSHEFPPALRIKQWAARESKLAKRKLTFEIIRKNHVVKLLK